MKIRVISVFRDKFTGKYYTPGEVIENQNVHEVSLCDMEGNPYLTVTMDAPLFGVWSPAGADVPFICVEPWYGRCDSADFTGDLKDREWGNLIAPGGIWKAHYTVEAV